MIRPLIIFVCGLSFAFSAFAAEEPEETPPPKPTYAVIVSASNTTGSLSRSLLSRMLLKKVTKWDDETTITPLDLSAKSETRAHFSKEIHKKSVKYIRRYWQKQMFSGRGTPPKQLKSDEDMLEYVAGNEGAIGYVSAGLLLPRSVRVVTVTDVEYAQKSEDAKYEEEPKEEDAE